MTNKSVILGLVAALLGSTAQAATITWDMSGGVAPPGHPAGTTENFNADGITISAAGFTNATQSTPTDLFLKNNHGDEVGLGIASGIDHEISGHDVVVVNFSSAIAAGLAAASFDFKMDSVTGSDSWLILGSTTGTAGSFTNTVMSGHDEALHSGLPLFNFYEVSAPSGTVLLSAVSGTKAQVSAPEPATLGLMTLGLLGAGIAGRKRRN